MKDIKALFSQETLTKKKPLSQEILTKNLPFSQETLTKILLLGKTP
jgi:hypothetical protein